MLFEVRTLEGRSQLDRAVQGALAVLVGRNASAMRVSRTDIARHLGVDPEDANGLRAVSASLRRGVKAGWAAASGKGPWQRYSGRPSS